MLNVLKIALRNLARFHRRTLLTSTLITLGVVAVLLFIATAGSFKAMMIGQFTDAVLGHIEIHRKGYVASIDNLPLNLNITPAMAGKIEQVLDKDPAIEAYSERVKFGAMFSNFTETTSVTRERHRSRQGDRDHSADAGPHHRGQQGAPVAQARRDPDSDDPRQGHESEGRRHGGARRDQPRRLGQREDFHGAGDHGGGFRPERQGRLHPHRGRARRCCAWRSPR